ncbi:hypothetical protein MMC19_000611 [Ptychographa xylographoides]|nr:hypothetical protein [Ptychographa xylographoides]
MYIVWKRNLEKNSPETLAAKLAAKHRGTAPTEAMYYAEGAFNRCYRVKFEEAPDAIVRFPALGRVSFRKEMVENEVCVMQYVARHTSIPVPKILGNGTCAVGPYVVMDFVEGSLLSFYLKALSDPTKLEVLDMNVSISALKDAYRGMARVVIALSNCRFSRIGALTQDKPGIWSVKKRALTMNHNQLIMLGNYPPKELPTNTFSTATDYFVALAKDHMHHLKSQRNDAVEDEADCVEKYVAHCLFLKIAQKFSTLHNEGPFRLFSEDLRPSNIIARTPSDVDAVIDWQFCYAAPAEFTYCSPWWLLLAHPDDWDDGLDNFLAHYLPKHEIFLQVLQECEGEAIKNGTLLESLDLSKHMAQSLCNGNFWFCLAATSSYSFDDIFWQFIDRKFHGDFTSIEGRIKLLSPEEQRDLEGFVHFKMEQTKERILDEHRTLDDILGT